ncbi:aminotransferase class V-fold PLP-dependent enzyme [Mesorhizobium sp. CAU 1741]|uniref:aminotransferase class V-fold PLP-dependent enzyme n=1 Tax=Mesorhizobium sp. CAU 1741 TaxID=3140366 RepID=UPI00325B34EB
MDLDARAVRADFPYLDERIYLNTASTGIAHRGTGKATARFFDDMYSRGFDGKDRWRSVTDDVKAQVGRLARVPAETVDFASSTTDALNRLALALPVRAGDRVAFCEDEFPSVRAVAELLARRGASLHPVAVPGEVDRTRVLADAASVSRFVLASHVHWETGTKIDLADISRATRSAGGYLIIDGIQALGATSVDAGLADAYVASVFKWLLAGFGLAISIVGPRLAGILEPAIRGYANPAPSRQLGPSHANYPGLFSLQSSLGYLEVLGWETIYQRNAALRSHLISKLDEFEAAIVTPEAAAAIVSIRCPDPQGYAIRLADRGISVEARGACLRVSPHFYNSEADIDHFASIFHDLHEEESR